MILHLFFVKLRVMLGMDGGFCTGGGQQGVFVINKNAKRDQAGEKESQQQSDFRPPF